MPMDPALRDVPRWSSALSLLANFFIVWFGIIAAMFSMWLVGAILLDAYNKGGLRGLALALVILAALPAFLIALRLRNRGEKLDGDRPSRDWWVRVAMGLLAGLFIAKGTWNMWTDPLDVTRPCLFCSPYPQYPLPRAAPSSDRGAEATMTAAARKGRKP